MLTLKWGFGGRGDVICFRLLWSQVYTTRHPSALSHFLKSHPSTRASLSIKSSPRFLFKASIPSSIILAHGEFSSTHFNFKWQFNSTHSANLHRWLEMVLRGEPNLSHHDALQWYKKPHLNKSFYYRYFGGARQYPCRSTYTMWPSSQRVFYLVIFLFHTNGAMSLLLPHYRYHTYNARRVSFSWETWSIRRVLGAARLSFFFVNTYWLSHGYNRILEFVSIPYNYFPS